MKARLALAFDEAFQPWLQLRSLLRVLSGNKVAELQGQPLEVSREGEKTRILLSLRGLNLEIEGTLKREDAVSRLMRLLEEVDGAVSVPFTSLGRFDLLLIEPYALPLHELVHRFKGAFLQPLDLVSTASDVGLSMDEKDGDRESHVAMGAMDPDQLRSEYLRFERRKLPPAFLFLGMGESRTDLGAFSREKYKDFLDTAAERHFQRAGLLAAIVTQ